MPTNLLVINEWIFADIEGANGCAAHRETHNFLQKLLHGNNKIAVMDGSPWMQKAWGLMRHYNVSDDDVSVRESSILIQQIIWDDDKCVRLQESDINAADAPAEVIADVIANAPEDEYLIRLYFAAQADLLITTDEKLRDALANHQEIEVVLKADFLESYLAA